jgi:putative iron-regulated protein
MKNDRTGFLSAHSVLPILGALAFVVGAALVPAKAQTSVETSPVELTDIAANYADLAQAGYEDALRTAQDLQTAIETLLDEPNADNLEAARTSWRIARVPYLQTEIFRFGNPLVAQWEQRVNAWPVDEGLIDYVGADYGSQSDANPLYTANIIANTQITVEGKSVDISRLSPEVIASLQGAAGVKTNVTTGYHAIEFLLWGPDDNAPVEMVEGDELQSGGTRLATDFSIQDCTNSNCERRREYLFSAVKLLISDLEEMVGNWQVTGEARRAITENPEAALVTMLSGMASLSYGELAGEHMQAGLDAADAELEQDDFSDYTYAAHLFDARGVVNVYLGEFFAIDGSTVTGPSLADYLVQTDPALDEEMRVKLSVTMARLRMLVNEARDVQNYDQMIAVGNDKGNGLIQAGIDSLVDQTRTIEKIAAALGIEQLPIKGSDLLEPL